jgi:hypothetical protein
VKKSRRRGRVRVVGKELLELVEQVGCILKEGRDLGVNLDTHSKVQPRSHRKMKPGELGTNLLYRPLLLLIRLENFEEGLVRVRIRREPEQTAAYRQGCAPPRRTQETDRTYSLSD